MAVNSWVAQNTAGHETHGQSAVYDESTGQTIALVYDGKANARLIAAAPELLAACERALAVLESEPECAIYKAHTDIVRNAIRKATQ